MRTQRQSAVAVCLSFGGQEEGRGVIEESLVFQCCCLDHLGLGT